MNQTIPTIHTNYLIDGLVHCYAAGLMCRAFCAAWADRTPTYTDHALTCLTCIEYIADALPTSKFLEL